MRLPVRVECSCKEGAHKQQEVDWATCQVDKRDCRGGGGGCCRVVPNNLWQPSLGQRKVELGVQHAAWHTQQTLDRLQCLTCVHAVRSCALSMCPGHNNSSNHTARIQVPVQTKEYLA
eukprot:1159797-Pelagomonas_calceolata.AAC.7